MFTFAGIASTYNPMKLGMRLLYLPRFDVDRWFDIVEERRPQATFVVPAMVELLIVSPRFDTRRPVEHPHLLARQRAGRPRHDQPPPGAAPEGHGLQRLGDDRGRAGLLLHAARGAGQAGRLGRAARCRRPSSASSTRTGHDLPAREIGELIVRNPGREREYFNDAEATASTWRDGWLHSGDLAYLDEDGFVYIVGRQKDVIIRGGNNVHAADVESVLYEHPAVQEVAVAGVPHAVLGEDIGAWVVLAPGAPTPSVEDELRAFCAERLSDYKVPRRVRLPRRAAPQPHRQGREARAARRGRGAGPLGPRA